MVEAISVLKECLEQGGGGSQRHPTFLCGNFLEEHMGGVEKLVSFSVVWRCLQLEHEIWNQGPSGREGL